MKSVFMKRAVTLIVLTMAVGFAFAQDTIHLRRADTTAKKRVERLTIGGYGEATYRYNFYSDNAFRYSYADRYANSKGHGQVDLPHVVLIRFWERLVYGHGNRV